MVSHIQKLEARKAALERSAGTTEAGKEKWRQVLVPSFMSSEESGEEFDDGDTTPVMYVKYLTWRHPQVNKFLDQMDHKVEKRKSKRAKLQTLPRRPGGNSRRPKPLDFPATFWGFAEK